MVDAPQKTRRESTYSSAQEKSAENGRGCEGAIMLGVDFFVSLYLCRDNSKISRSDDNRLRYVDDFPGAVWRMCHERKFFGVYKSNLARQSSPLCKLITNFILTASTASHKYIGFRA